MTALPSENEVTEVTQVTSLNQKAPSRNPASSSGVTESNVLTTFDPLNTPPDALPAPQIKRPSFKTHDDWFEANGKKCRPGLYWHSMTDAKGNAESKPVDDWIASPIHVVASTCDQDGQSFGRLLRVMDSNGRWKEATMPMRKLSGSGEDLRAELLSLGVLINTDKQRHLNQFLMQESPKDRVTAALTTGWYERSFVLPSRTIGDASVRFQSDALARTEYRAAGTLKQWRDDVAIPCGGNPLLVLAVSVALAGPLVLRAKGESRGGFGVHLQGDSSRGKTTALQAAASVWNGPDFVGTWRATSNGLEGAAASRNDTILILDEISECDPKEIGAIAYSLGNGIGKQRAMRNGSARAAAQWRLPTLSSGERTLAAHMSECHRQAKAGQEARFFDIPATNRRFGLFDNIHDFATGGAFSDALKDATAARYGTAGPELVRKMIDDPRDLRALYAKARDLPYFDATEGLEKRAGKWFALIGFGGELATEYGITGWAERDALDAARECFDLWRAQRGSGQTEDRQITRMVRDYLERHGDSLFSRIDDDQTVVRDRAGYWRDEDGARVYYFNSPGLRSACPGHDFPRVLSALEAANWIAHRDVNKRSKRVRVGGTVTVLYAIRPESENDA